MAQQYLSTDPNAGEPVEYLSLDPDTGEPIAVETPDAPPADSRPSRLVAEPKRGMRQPSLDELRSNPDFQRMDADRRSRTPSGTVQGAMMAAPFTGGMSIPTAMATTAAGAFAGGLADGDTAEDAAWGAAREGALQGVGGTMIKGGQAVARQAVPLVRSYLKPTMSMLRHRAGIEGEAPNAVANRIAKFIVDEKLTTADKARRLVETTGRQIDDAAAAAERANPELALDTAERIPRYLTGLLRRVERQILPGRDRAAIQNVAKELVEDSPLSRSTFVPPPAETLEQGLARGARSAMTEAANAGKPRLADPRGIKTQFSDIGGPFPQSSRPRALRVDVKPTEALTTLRERSFFDPTATGGQLAGGRTIERAVRDAVKQAVPEASRPLLRQGRAMDAARLLDRGEHLAGNRDTLGGFAQTVGAASGRSLTGLLMQALKEGQLRLGVHAPKIGAAIQAGGRLTPQTVRLLKLMATSHDQE